MAIRFKYEAAAVAPTSNETTRRFGQNLVMQQQQQKYQAQQAGFDRWFDAAKQANQNTFQWGRDLQQNSDLVARQKAQNEFQVGRDKTLFEQQQQEAEAERQRKFLDDARKQSSGMIMEDIKNGEFDPVTARKLQQNLVAEAEALGNPQLDATQRAEALAKIRAERTLLTANRQQKPPPPSAQDQFNQGIVVDPKTGMRYRQNAKGDYEPLPEQEQKPKSAQEYYSANEDKFQKDLDATLKSMQDAFDLDPSKPKPTPEAAWAQMQKDYQFRQQALGQTSPAGPPSQLPSEQMPPALGTVDPMTGQPVQAGAMSPAGVVSSPPPLAQATPAADIPIAAPDQAQPPSPKMSSAETPNPWAEVATEDAPKRGRLPLTANASSRNPAGADQMAPVTPPSQPAPQAATDQPSGAPDFGALSASATNETDRSFYSQMETVYKGQTPDVQSAIGVLLNPDSEEKAAGQALEYLQSKGIDINQLAAEASKTPIEKTKDKMRKKYGENYDSF